MNDLGAPDILERIGAAVLLVVAWWGWKALRPKPQAQPTAEDMDRLQAANEALRGQLEQRDDGLRRLEARGRVIHMFIRQDEERRTGLHLVHNDALEALEGYLIEIDNVLSEVPPKDSTPV